MGRAAITRRLSGLQRSAGMLGAMIVIALATASAHAEWQISVYGGINENFSSKVVLDKAPVTDSRTIDWDGRSFETPPYWGVRGTYWWNSHWGVALDYTHSKGYANLNFATDPIYNHLEFTDGNNLLLLNLMYRGPPWWDGRVTPYVGLGIGVAVPHVEVRLKAFPGQETWEYQLAGVAVQALGGFDLRLTNSWSLFAEAKLSYSKIDADLVGGGSLSTELRSPQLAVGVTYRFGGL